MSRLAIRSHYWGALVVVVVGGDLDAEGAARLAAHLRRLQRGNDLLVDLWDVTRCDSEGVAALEAAKHRADVAGWGFAIVTDPAGPCAEALEAGDVASAIPTFSDRRDARAALHQPS